MKTASQPFWRRSRERDADGAGFWGPHLIFGLELSCSGIYKENRRLENTSAISREIGGGKYIVFFKREIGDAHYIGFFKGKISFSMGISVYLQIYRALIKRNRLIFGYRRKGCINRRICKFIGISLKISVVLLGKRRKTETNRLHKDNYSFIFSTAIVLICSGSLSRITPS